MEFKNYCIIVLGKTEGFLAEIENVAEGEVKTLPAKGIIIGTFNSAFKVPELEDYFKEYDRNFLIFELNPKTSGYNIKNEVISNNLFGSPKNINLELEKMSNNLIDDIKHTTNVKPISGSSKNFVIEDNVDEIEVASEYYKTLNPKEKQSIMDSIIDKGVENLTDTDKEILGILSKKQ